MPRPETRSAHLSLGDRIIIVAWEGDHLENLEHAVLTLIELMLPFSVTVVPTQPFVSAKFNFYRS
jgi:hypothetical protein